MSDPADSPPLDPTVLDAIRKLQKPGAPDLVQRIVGLYLEDSARTAGSLHECLVRRDAQGAFRAAHALKSASGNVGARALAALCREIEALSHEGRIEEAASRADSFAAEYARVRTARSAPPEMPDRPLEGPQRVLVVDDDRGLRELARAAIEAEGFEVEDAADGEAALAAFERRRPDLVLLDVVMPGIDGYQACERLRAPGGRHLPILVMTGLDDDASIRRAYGAGATDFITKPIPWQLLGQRMRYMLRAGRAFAEVEASRAMLEARVAERTAELKASNEELEAFCAAASHDLRAPLRWIGSYAGMLAEDNLGLAEESRLHLQRILASSQSLAAMLEALLAMSRVTLREVSWESFDFTALAMDVLQAQRDAHPQRRIELAIQPGMRARGDRDLVRIVLSNLVSNACKYTSETAGARLEIGCIDGPEPVYFVKDNGAGFDMAHAQKLFMPFRRLHDPGRFDGIGIGLSTVKRIVARHGGRIWAEGEPERGATFRFTLAPSARG